MMRADREIGENVYSDRAPVRGKTNFRKKLSMCRFCDSGNHLKCTNATKNMIVCACRCMDKKSLGDY